MGGAEGPGDVHARELAILNAVAEVLRITDRPNADADACTGRPHEIPRLVKNAARFPCWSVTFATSAMSTPGKIVSSAAMPMNATRDGSIRERCPGRRRCSSKGSSGSAASAVPRS